MTNNIAVKLRVFSLVLIQMIVAVVLGVLFIFTLNKYYDTTSFNLSLNMGKPLNEQSGNNGSHQEFNINLKDFENNMTAQGNIELTSTMDKYKSFSNFLDNCLSFNRKVLNAQINLQLADNTKLKTGEATLDTSKDTPTEGNQFYGQVIANGLNLRKGPSLDSQIFYTLNKGEVLKVFGKIGKWYMVYSPTKKLTGSVFVDYINPVD